MYIILFMIGLGILGLIATIAAVKFEENGNKKLAYALAVPGVISVGASGAYYIIKSYWGYEPVNAVINVLMAILFISTIFVSINYVSDRLGKFSYGFGKFKHFLQLMIIIVIFLGAFVIFPIIVLVRG